MLGIRITNSKVDGLHNNKVMIEMCVCTLFPIRQSTT